MMPRFILATILCLISPFTNAEPPEGYPFMKYDQGIRLAQQNKQKVFLYFGRFGCGYCGKVNLDTFSDPNLRKRYIKNYVLVYVDAESGDRITLPSGERITEMELGARLNVFATPVFAYLEPNGEMIFKAPGFKTVKDFVDFDRYVQGEHYRTKSINEFLSSSP